MHPARSLIVLALAMSVAACDTTQATPPPASASLPSNEPAATGPGVVTGSPGPNGSVPPEGLAATATDLIIADLEAGLIDAPTALLYRVYAVFGDPRLPEAYRSDVELEDGAALAAARMEIDTLPAAIADELRPFLVRPTDPSSVFYDVRAASGSAGGRLAAFRGTASVGAAPAAAAQAGPAAVTCNPVSGWGYAKGIANFKVWGECGTPDVDADIQQVVSMVEGFWDAETAFLSREPLADGGTPNPDEWLNDGGGDERIDFYLVNACQTRGGSCRAMGASSLGETLSTYPYTTVKGVGVWSSYVLLPLALLQNAPLFRATVAHEMFHVLQSSMNFEGRFNRTTKLFHWVSESTAKWAEWHFSGVADNVEPWHNLFQVTVQPLDEVANGNAYASFTWPLFMVQQAGDPAVIARLWQALEGKADFREIAKAIDSARSFKEWFRVFALRNWNEELGVGDPVEPLLPLPPTMPGRPKPESYRREADVQLTADPPGSAHTVAGHIPGLWASYIRFTVDPDVGQVILDFSGISSPQAYFADALVKVKDQGWERRKLKKGTTTWCMDNPDDDIEEFVVVLSNHDYDRTLAYGDWTYESLLEPCLSYEVHIDWTDVYDNTADKFTFDGWIDTIDPDLSGNGVITLNGTGTISGGRPGWASCNPGIGGVPAGSGAAIFVASIAGETMSIGAFPDLTATHFGVSTQPFTMEREGGTLTIQSQGNTGGSLCPHSWKGTITATLKLKEPIGNDEGP